MANTSIVVAGQKFDCGCRVILWDEQEGMSFYPAKYTFVPRNLSLSELRKIINAFYIHHSVTYFAHSTFQVLKERKLSCNFIIDDDINEDTGCSTIYQCLDVKDYGYSQGGEYNKNGSGVEISYYPDAWDHPNRYSTYYKNKFGVKDHKVISDQVQGHKFSKAFAPTDAQVKACIHLISGYKKAFPDLELKFPRDETGKFLSKTVENDKRHGLLHHFNIRTDKIDALGFPTDYVEQVVNEMDQIEKLKSKPFILDKILKRKPFLDKILNWVK